MTLILGIKNYNKSLRFCDFDNLQSMHDLLKITRDKLIKSTSKVYINLWKYNSAESKLVDLTTDELASSNITMNYSHTNKDGLLSAPTPSPQEQL